MFAVSSAFTLGYHDLEANTFLKYPGYEGTKKVTGLVDMYSIGTTQARADPSPAKLPIHPQPHATLPADFRVQTGRPRHGLQAD